MCWCVKLVGGSCDGMYAWGPQPKGAVIEWPGHSDRYRCVTPFLAEYITDEVTNGR